MEYSINGSVGPWQTSNVFTDLTPGTYTVAVRYQDHTNCINIPSNTIVFESSSDCFCLDEIPLGTRDTALESNEVTFDITGGANTDPKYLIQSV